MNQTGILDDHQLLEAFAASGDQAAFSQIVDRHARWVFAAAFRQLHDHHLAQDAVQVVFVLLAQKAHTMNAGQKFSGWLFNALRYTVKNFRRAEKTRRKHEAVAARPEVQESQPQPEMIRECAEQIDSAVARLSNAHRQAILLRFYQELPFDQVAQTLGTKEAAARKRVDRALVALRKHLAGATTSAVSASAAYGLDQSPPLLASTIAHGVTGASVALPPAVVASAKAVEYLMTMTKLKTAAVIAVICLMLACVPASFVIWHASASADDTPPSAAVASQTNHDVAPPAPIVPPKGADNNDAVKLYLLANQSVKAVSPSASDFNFPELPPYSPQWNRMEKAAFDANKAMFALAHQATFFDKAEWPTGKDSGTYLHGMRNLANQLSDAAAYLELQGNDAAAIEKINDLLHMTDLLDKGSKRTLVRFLVSGGCRDLAMHRLLIISSNIQLTADPADQRDVQVADVRQLIAKLLDQTSAADRMVEAKVDHSWFVGSDAAKQTDHAMERFNRVNTECGFAAMSLACHLFQFEHQRWPNLLNELIPNDLPHAPIDPWGDGKQTLGYVLIKHGLPDGSDRPLVYSRSNSGDGLFFRLDRPMYLFYDPIPGIQNQGGQFRDVARWLPTGNTPAAPTTQELIPQP